MFGDRYQGIDASIRDAIIHLFKMKQAVNDQGSAADAVTQHTAVINMYFRAPLISSGLFKAGFWGFMHLLLIVHHRYGLGRKHPDFQTCQAGNSIRPPNMKQDKQHLQTRIKMTPGDKDIRGLCISFESSRLLGKN